MGPLKNFLDEGISVTPQLWRMEASLSGTLWAPGIDLCLSPVFIFPPHTHLINPVELVLLPMMLLSYSEFSHRPLCLLVMFPFTLPLTDHLAVHLRTPLPPPVCLCWRERYTVTHTYLQEVQTTHSIYVLCWCVHHSTVSVFFLQQSLPCSPSISRK